jgi:hypothetical protein
LKNFSSPSITSRREDCRRMDNGIITSLNLRIRREPEPFINAVKKVKGKSNTKIKMNLFNGTLSTDLYFAIKTRNKRMENEKKNIL